MASTKHTEIHSDFDSEEPLLSLPPIRSDIPSLYPRYLTSFVTRRLFVTLANYVTLGFLDASLYASYSLLLATPISSGGLGFTPDTIGYISGIASFCHGLIQAFCFAPILKRWDARNVYAVSIIAYILLYLMMPVTNFIARRAGRVTPTVWGLLVLEGLLFFSSYSAYGECDKHFPPRCHLICMCRLHLHLHQSSLALAGCAWEDLRAGSNITLHRGSYSTSHSDFHNRRVPAT